MVCKLKSAPYGRHVEVRVFMGPDRDHLALAGVLMMDLGEWQLFGTALLIGARATHGQFEVISEGDGKVIAHFAEQDRAEAAQKGIP